MNIIKRAIPSISGIITGVFVWDLLAKRVNVLVLAIIFGILFNFLWLSYSKKISKKALEKDALTFIPFIALVLAPVKNLVSFESRYMQFGNLPSSILLIFSISAFLFLKVLFYKNKIKDLKNDKLIYFIIIIYFLLFSTLTILKHESFFSTGHDLAIYDQTVWGYSNFNLTPSLLKDPMLGSHVQPILFIVSLFYFIYSSPLTLIVIQTAMVALGALPIYLLSKRVLKNNLVSILLSAAYLIYPSMQFANLFDFHPIVLAVPFILFSFYFLEKHNYKASIIFLVLAGLCKEHIPLIFIPIGAYLFLKHKKKRLGVSIALIGLIWFIVNMQVIIPYFAAEQYLALATNDYFGSSFSGAIKTFITRPIYSARYFIVLNKFAFLTLLVIPMAFGLFAILAPEFLLLGITELGILFIHQPNSLSEIVYHHQTSSIAFIIVATIYGVRRFHKLVKNRNIKKNLMIAAGILLISTSLLANISYGPFKILYDLKDFNPYSDYAKTGKEFISTIPKEASVAAPNWILPHLSQREEVYALAHFLRGGSKKFESGEVEYPEYIIIELGPALTDPKRSALKIRDIDLNNLFNNKRYGIIKSEGIWILLKKGENYEQNLCKILPFLNKEEYPYLKLNLDDEESLKECWQKR